MKTENNKKEQELFKYLDASCQPHSTPIPNKIFEIPMKCEIRGFMCRMICEAFINMRESAGESNWECNAVVALGSKISEKRVMTVNTLRKYLLKCQGLGLIEYSKEVDDKIIVKINISLLFEDLNK